MERTKIVTIVTSAIAAAALAACAGSGTQLTELGYSSWSGRVNSMGEFKRARAECFERLQIEDPASVAAGSPLESRFAKCMRTKGWCSDTGSCN